MIHSFTFVPDPSGYIALLQNVDGSLTQCKWHNVSPRLNTLLEREASNGIRHVTVGANNSYVVILHTGAVWWLGVPTSLNLLLRDAEKKNVGVVVSNTAFAGLTITSSLPADHFLDSCTLPHLSGLVFRRIR
jgi:hypothetical protein